MRRRITARGREGKTLETDAFAPDIELDTIRLVEHEVLMNPDLIDDLPENPEPERFWECYVHAQDAYERARRDREERDPMAVKTGVEGALDSVWWFGDQASRRARHKSMERVLVNFTLPDRCGIVAEAAQALAAVGANVQGGRMTIIGGNLIMTLLLSGRESARQAQATFDKALRNTCGNDASSTLAVVPLAAANADYPLPGSTFWHLVARQQEGADLLTGVTEILAEDAAIVSLTSTHVDGDEHLVDLTFALAPQRGTDPTRKAQRLREQVQENVGDAQVTLTPVGPPSSATDRGRTTPVSRALVLTIVGRAEPGFVDRSLAAVKAETGLSAIYASSMVVLEGISALTIILPPERTDQLREATGSPSHFEQAIAAKILDRQKHPHLVRLHVPPKSSKASKATMTVEPSPTHVVELQVVEQPRVLARAAQVLADNKANIIWLTSHVLEPRVGETWSRCAITLHVVIPDEHEQPGTRGKQKKRAKGKQTAGDPVGRRPVDAIDAGLKSLAAREGWDRIWLRPWTLVTTDDD